MSIADTYRPATLERCLTCFRDPADPFRSRDETGRILNGCVDAAHDGRLTPISSDATWHYTKDAKAIRRANLKHTPAALRVAEGA